MITYQNWPTAPAPSSAAASDWSWGTSRRAARITSVENGRTIQAFTNDSASSAR